MKTLQEVVDSVYIWSQDSADLLRNIPRWKLNKAAKDGLQKLHLTFATHITSRNVQVPSSCVIYKPEGFERLIRAYIINCDGKTIEINRNNKIPTEIYGLLINCDGTIISDCAGDLLTECLGCNASVKVCEETIECGSCGHTCNTSSELSQLLYDLEKYKNTWIKENQDFFEFSSDLEDVWIHIDYLTNQTLNVDECEIQVPEKFAEALEYYMKFKVLESGQETMGQSQYFWKKFKFTRDKELTADNALTKTDLQSIILMKQ